MAAQLQLVKLRKNKTSLPNSFYFRRHAAWVGTDWHRGLEQICLEQICNDRLWTD
jgi:hypothetical protein